MNAFHKTLGGLFRWSHRRLAAAIGSGDPTTSISCHSAWSGLERLEDRVLLSADSLIPGVIEFEQAAALRAGFGHFASFAEELAGHDKIAQTLPLLEQSLDQAIDVASVINDQIVQPIDDFFANDTSPTTDELIAELQDLGGAFSDLTVDVDVPNVTGGFGTGSIGEEVRFTLPLIATRTLSLPIDFADAEDKLPLSVSGEDIDVTASLELDVTFGAELTPGLSTDDAFFMQFDTAQLRLVVDEPSIVFDFSLGFLGVQSPEASFYYEVIVDLLFDNPDFSGTGVDDGKISGAEIAGTSVEGLVDPVPTTNVDLQLPLTSSLGALGREDLIVITGDPFAPEGLDYILDQDAESTVHSFFRLTPDGVVRTLEGVGSWLSRVTRTAPLSPKMPLLDVGEFGDMLDLGSLFQTNVTDLLRTGPDAFSFSNAQEFAAQLASLLDVPVEEVGLRWDGRTQFLQFTVKLDESVAATTGPLDFDFSADSVAGIETTGNATINASGEVEFTLYIRRQHSQHGAAAA